MEFTFKSQIVPLFQHCFVSLIICFTSLECKFYFASKTLVISKAVLSFGYSGKLSFTKNLVLPISLLIEYWTLCLRLDLLDLKYTFDLSRFICFQEPTRSNRKRYWNPLTWTLHPSNSHPDFFFVRAVRSYNYLHRHNITKPGSVGMKKKIKNFQINKTFNINSRCSYFICCTCSSCIDLVSLC